MPVRNAEIELHVAELATDVIKHGRLGNLLYIVVGDSSTNGNVPAMFDCRRVCLESQCKRAFPVASQRFHMFSAIWKFQVRAGGPQ